MFTEDNIFNLEETLLKHGNRIAFKTKDQSITYLEWFKQIEQTTNWLQSLNISAQEQVAIQMENCPQILSLIFGLWQLKAIPILIAPESPNQSSIRTITKIPPLESSDQKYNFSFTLNQTGLVIFTSGTTNKKKGVELTIENILYSALGSIKYFNLSPEHSWNLSLPMSRIAGLMIPFRTLLAGACTCFATDATHYSVVPSQIEKMTDQLKTAEAVLIGGGPIPQHCRIFCNKNSIPMFTSYGMSEMTSTIAIGKDNKVTILPYRDLKIDDGHIAVRGKCRFQGYLNGDQPFDSQGYFYTGDLGSMDSNGLKVLGRSDTIFISGGINIDPFLIETLLLEIDQINGAIVVPADDTKWGQVAIAFIEAQEEFDWTTLNQSLSKRIHPHYIPKAFYPAAGQSRSELLKKARTLWSNR